MSGVQHLLVGADEAEQRLDRWLRRQFPHLAQGRIEKLCRKGEIRVEGGRVKPATRVQPGQSVRIPPLPELSGEPVEPSAPVLDDVLASTLLAAVLHRDEEILVLNKPPGLAVQGGSNLGTHLAAALPGLRFGREDAPRLVHRLDKDTSGLLVLARSGKAAHDLAALFRSRAVEKIYLAAVAGRPQPAQGTIRYGLVKAGRKGEGEKMRVL
ncbi:MAG: RluA family pseudouridine synthase, partial [Pseudomonadota bacterium]